MWIRIYLVFRDTNIMNKVTSTNLVYCVMSIAGVRRLTMNLIYNLKFSIVHKLDRSAVSCKDWNSEKSRESIDTLNVYQCRYTCYIRFLNSFEIEFHSLLLWMTTS